MHLDPLASFSLADGSTSTLAEIIGDGPIALVLLRHFGCLFCQEHADELSKLQRNDIVLVGMGTRDQAQFFLSKLEHPMSLILDPERRLYNTIELPRATTKQVLNLRTIAAGVRATAKGFRQTAATGDPLQLPGVAVLKKGGEVAWRHVAKNPADNPPGHIILAKIEEAKTGP